MMKNISKTILFVLLASVSLTHNSFGMDNTSFVGENSAKGSEIVDFLVDLQEVQKKYVEKKLNEWIFNNYVRVYELYIKNELLGKCKLSGIDNAVLSIQELIKHVESNVLDLSSVGIELDNFIKLFNTILKNNDEVEKIKVQISQQCWKKINAWAYGRIGEIEMVVKKNAGVFEKVYTTGVSKPDFETFCTEVKSDIKKFIDSKNWDDLKY